MAKVYKVQARLDENERRRLLELQRITGQNESELVRQLLRTAELRPVPQVFAAPLDVKSV